MTHAALGCAASAAEGTGCVGGAIGGAASALISPFLVEQAGGASNLTDQECALITSIAMISGGGIAGLLGQNATGGATAAENEALNNSEQDHSESDELKKLLAKERSELNAGGGKEIIGYDEDDEPIYINKPPLPRAG